MIKYNEDFASARPWVIKRQHARSNGVRDILACGHLFHWELLGKSGLVGSALGIDETEAAARVRLRRAGHEPEHSCDFVRGKVDIVGATDYTSRERIAASFYANFLCEARF